MPGRIGATGMYARCEADRSSSQKPLHGILTMLQPGVQIPECFTREMGITLSEFQRTLPSAVSPLTFSWEGRVVTVNHPDGHIQISLGETSERALGSFRLPVTPVEFLFVGPQQNERQEFIERFDLCFHRGGG